MYSLFLVIWCSVWADRVYVADCTGMVEVCVELYETVEADPECAARWVPLKDETPSYFCSYSPTITWE